MLPKKVLLILYFFDVCGYCTKSTALTKSKIVRKLIFTVHILSATFFTLYLARLAFDLYPLIGLGGTINEMLQYIVGLFTYWLIIFDACLHQNKHQHFWQVIEQIDKEFCSRAPNVSNYLWYLIEYFSVTILLFTLIYFSKILPQVAFTICAFWTLIIICQLRAFYYIFCMEAVIWQLKMIEHEIIVMKHRSLTLANCNKLTHFVTPRTFYTFDFKRFKWINGYYDYVIEMTKSLNDVFGWSQVASILFYFYSLATDINWYYINFSKIPIKHSLRE